MALLTVIIPAFNCIHFLEKAVLSVLDQPCTEIDVVIVDDGSTDGTAMLCDRLAQVYHNVKVLHQENKGVSAARNNGIAYVLESDTFDGGYIAFLDADDFWLPNVFDDAFIKELFLDKDKDLIAFGGCLCNKEATRYSQTDSYPTEEPDVNEQLVWRFYNKHFGRNLYSARLLEKWDIRFPEKNCYSEDKIFLTKCVFLSKHIFLSSKPLHVYRCNNDSAMHKVREIRPIEYFLPIIDGWLAFDKYINSKSSETGKESSIGQTLAGIYFLDMATEHFQRFGKRSELENVFSEHPGFNAFINMKENAVSKKQYNEHLMLLNHPGIFTLKNYGIGFFESVLWTLKDFWVIQSIREKKKYPIQNSPLRGNL